MGATRKKRGSPSVTFLKAIVSFVELKKARIEKEEKEEKEERDQIKNYISSLTKQIGEIASVITSLANTFSALAEKINKKG